MQSVFLKKILILCGEGEYNSKKGEVQGCYAHHKKGVIAPRISEDKQHSHNRKFPNAYSGVVSDGAKEFDSKFCSTTL